MSQVAVDMRGVVAFAGGVGGAKLAHGLYRSLPSDQLTVIVNTADDFDLWGLRICPDADTVMYTLAGFANTVTGWGVADDTWQALDMLGRYGDDTWFRVGDRDFATHITRTERLRSGARLTEVIDGMARSLSVQATLLPMCDETVATLIDTPAGRLHFQDYFVRRQHRDAVNGVVFSGIAAATLTDEVRAALNHARAIVFCPSNPFVSIGPILAVPGMRDQLVSSRAPKIAVSPIIGGAALKGPADQMLAGLGHDVSALGVARLYRDLLDGFVIDAADADQQAAIEALGLRVLVTDTIMRSDTDRQRLGAEVLRFVEERI